MTFLPTAAASLSNEAGDVDHPRTLHQRLLGVWYDVPFRWQILSAVMLTSLITWLMAGALAVFDSRARAAVETRATIDLWQNYISVKAANASPEWGVLTLHEQLTRELQQVRHVEATIIDLDGHKAVSTAPADPAPGEERDRNAPQAPHWFISLVQPAQEIREFPFWVGNRRLGTVRLIAKPDDEIAEGWELLRKMSLLWLAASLGMMAGLHYVLGRILIPLLSFAAGMRRLEDGHYNFRVAEPRLQELEPIARNFNTLATALETARTDNAQLYRQLIAVQEDERRQIAADLHDEFGPCLFGISASTGAIERLTRQIEKPIAKDILRSTAEIAAINDHMKSLNRALLGRLRPVAIGRITVSELLSELICDFERRHPEIRFDRNFSSLPARLGEAVELTLYRSVQEGLTNALRHGQASSVGLSLEIDLCDDDVDAARSASVDLDNGAFPMLIRLVITDNGRGLPAGTPMGFGLSSMRERVRALHGSMSIRPGSPGMVLEVAIPISPAQINEG